MSILNKSSGGARRFVAGILVALSVLTANQSAFAVCGDANITSPPAGSDGGTLLICQSAMNKYAAAVLPLSRSVDLQATIWIPSPLIFPVPVVFNGSASANVITLTFAINNGSVVATADVTGQIFGFTFSTRLMSTVNVVLQPVTETLAIIPGPLSFVPRVEVFPLINVDAPYTVDVGRSITIPEIPLGAVIFEIQTAEGQRELLLDAYDHDLIIRPGFLELRSNVRIR